jgi:hypothetical protein
MFDPLREASPPLRDCASVGEEIMKRLGLGIIVAIGLTLPAFGQGVDPFIGTWKLNTAKSTSTYPLNKSLTLNIVREGQTLWSPTPMV